MHKLLLFLFCLNTYLFAEAQTIVDSHTEYFTQYWNKTTEANAYYTIKYKATLGAFMNWEKNENEKKKKKNDVLTKSRFPISWHEEVFDQNGHIISSGEFSNGYYDGKWTRFYPDGHVKEVTTYENGQKIKYLSYYENGNFEYKDGKYFYDTGELEKEEIDLSMELTVKKEYFLSGKVKKITYLKRDTTAIDSIFIDSGELKSRTVYQNGKISLFEEFHPAGQLCRSKEYSQDSAKAKVFSEEGLLLKEEIYFQSEKINEIIHDSSTVSPKETTQEVFTLVEEMPAFKGCEKLESDERNLCTQKEIVDFIISNYYYPTFALEKGIQGKEYIRFIVDAEGNVTKITSAGGSNSILTEFAIRLVSSMPKFTPGMQKGKHVPVQYIIPINYKIG